MDRMSTKNALINSRVTSATDILGIIYPEEVRIEDSLQDPGKHGDRVPMTVCKVSIEPIRDIKCPIRAQSEEVVCCYRFRFASPL